MGVGGWAASDEACGILGTVPDELLCKKCGSRLVQAGDLVMCYLPAAEGDSAVCNPNCAACGAELLPYESLNRQQTLEFWRSVGLSPQLAEQFVEAPPPMRGDLVGHHRGRLLVPTCSCRRPTSSDRVADYTPTAKEIARATAWFGAHGVPKELAHAILALYGNERNPTDIVLPTEDGNQVALRGQELIHFLDRVPEEEGQEPSGRP